MYKLALPLLILALSTQCQPKEETYTNTETWSNSDGIKLGQEFTLQQYEQITLFSEEVPRRLYLTLNQLADSRCPANTNCVQYGNATLTLSASNSQGKNEKIELCIGDCGTGQPRDTHTVTAQVGEPKYEITLKEVKPHPGQEHDGEVQKAKLIVKKL